MAIDAARLEAALQAKSALKPLSSRSAEEKREAEAADKATHHKLKRLIRSKGNQKCADCHVQYSGWASLPHGVFLCIDCAQLHRGIGRHVSQVKAINTGTYLWYSDEVDVMVANGNDLANNLLLAKHPKGVAACVEPHGSHADRVSFLRDKYERRRWALSEREIAAEIGSRTLQEQEQQQQQQLEFEDDDDDEKEEEEEEEHVQEEEDEEQQQRQQQQQTQKQGNAFGDGDKGDVKWADMQEGILYCPKDSQYPFVDMMWRVGNELFAVQVSTAKSHPKGFSVFSENWLRDRLGIADVKGMKEKMSIRVFYAIHPTDAKKFLTRPVPASFMWTDVERAKEQLQEYEGVLSMAILKSASKLK